MVKLMLSRLSLRVVSRVVLPLIIRVVTLLTVVTFAIPCLLRPPTIRLVCLPSVWSIIVPVGLLLTLPWSLWSRPQIPFLLGFLLCPRDLRAVILKAIIPVTCFRFLRLVSSRTSCWAPHPRLLRKSLPLEQVPRIVVQSRSRCPQAVTRLCSLVDGDRTL